MTTDGPNITSLELEDRRFPPPADFAAQANAQAELYEKAAADPEAFWLAQTRELLTWDKEPTEGVDRSNPPFFSWFADGTLNASVNCLDRHLAARGDQVAFFWEGEPDERLEITYRDLYERVCRLANGLRQRGVGKGDRVAIYLGMIPEIVVAMLACARIGAPHTVIFGGFSPDSVRDRVLDCGVTAMITGDGAWRGGKLVPLKANVNAALEGAPDVHTCVVVRRTENEIGWVDGRDVWYHELAAGQPAECEPEMVGAEHPLYILYTSGSTGKPKGILHTTGGYLTGVAATHRWVFDLKDDDVYWCAADVGWVTGHSYIAYGPLANGATSILYEGAPGTPDKDRWWEIIARYKVTILYCAPTAIRTFMKWGVEYPAAPRPDLAAPARLGRRADQPRGLDLVPRDHRRRHLPRGGHLVADRDRQHHDLAPSGRDHAEARVGHEAPAGHHGRRRGRERQQRPARRGRLPGALRALAGHAAHPLRRRRPLRATRTGANTGASTWPATAPAATPTATTGCSGASTT